MKRLTECWLEFDGILDTDMHVQLAEMPTRELPVRRGQQYNVLGRSGTVFLPEGEHVYDSLGFVVYLTTLDGFSPAAFTNWILNKEALLRFSDEPDRAYMAQVIEQPSRHNTLTRFDTQTISVTFTAQPWRYHVPEADDIVITASGSTISNPGTAPSAPRFVITATGDITLTIGGTNMDFSGLTEPIIVDSQLMDCFTQDGITLGNNAQIDDFPMLGLGDTTITFTGAVEKITVQPRWRDI